MTQTLYDIFASFFGDLSNLDPNVAATLAVCLGIFVIDSALRVLVLFVRSIFNLN